MNKLFKVLCVGGSDSGGGAGIQADLKTVAGCTCYGLTAITALTAQNTQGVQDIFPVPPKFIAAQLDAVLSDIGTDALKTGMLLTRGAVEVVAQKIEQYKLTPVVVDPVMVAKGGRTMMREAACRVMIKKLLPLAEVVTPNIPEAELMAQKKITSLAEAKEAANIIFHLGVKNVVIKGGHLPQSHQSGSVDLLFDGKKYYEFSGGWIQTKNTHGTGCVFASALACFLARGAGVIEAAKQAKDLVARAIANSLSLGKGHGPVSVLEKEHQDFGGIK